MFLSPQDIYYYHLCIYFQKEDFKKSLMGNHIKGLWKLKVGYLKYQNAIENDKQKSKNTLKYQQEQRV